MTRIRQLAAFALLLIVPIATPAQSPFWVPTAPIEGGQVFAIVASSPGTLIAATTTGVYRSTDNGATWHHRWTATVTGTNIDQAIALSLDSTGALFAATARGNVLRSTDDGTTWSERRSGIPVTSVQVNSLAASATQMALATANGVFVTNDGGETWVPTGLTGRALAVVYSPSGTLYAIASGVRKASSDRTTWQRLDSLLRDRVDVASLVALRDSVLVLTSSSGASYRSTDEGASWTALDSVIVRAGPTTLAVGPDGSIVALGRGVARSVNAGATWQEVPLSGPFAYPVQAAVVGPLELVAATRVGVLRSVDGGRTWSVVNRGISAVDITSIADGVTPGSLFAVSIGTVYTSTNNGESWQIAASWATPATGLEPVQIASISASPTGTLMLAYGLPFQPAILVSEDAGRSWIPADSGIYPYPRSAAYRRDGLAFAVTDLWRYVFRSSDDGRSWSRSTAGSRQVLSVAFDLQDRVLAGTERGVWRSSDDGLTYQPLGDSITQEGSYLLARSVAVPPSGTIVVGGTLGRMYRLAAGETRWSLTRQGDGIEDRELDNVLSAPGGDLYAASTTAVLRSTDDGRSWSSISDGLNYSLVHDLHLSANGYLFAGTYGGGVYRSAQPVAPASIAQPITASGFDIYAVRPNPALSSTTVSIVSRSNDRVQISARSMLGGEVTKLYEGETTIGLNQLVVPTEDLPSGIYLLRVQIGDEVDGIRIAVTH